MGSVQNDVIASRDVADRRELVTRYDEIFSLIEQNSSLSLNEKHYARAFVMIAYTTLFPEVMSTDIEALRFNLKNVSDVIQQELSMPFSGDEAVYPEAVGEISNCIEISFSREIKWKFVKCSSALDAVS